MTQKQKTTAREAQSAETAYAAAAAGLETGTVTALITEQEAMVTLQGGAQIHADQAAGCLLAPAIGDTVLVFQQDDTAYILSVLTRHNEVAAEIGVAGAQNVTLKASRKLAVQAPEVNLNARHFAVLAENVTQTGKQLISNFTKSFETIVDKLVNARSISTTAQTRTSAVKETETLKAGILVQNIDSVATQNSDISMITAQEDVRLDAKRVSVG
ncbi:DUF3540 domain-containing protein [Roseibium denhamense]|uniref:DUF3540 domain-containing protein n=1 Tax=Roseibium denhamense TaxID=76305 RepID=A0ABY1NW85_9HYPH|nr:DUF3540 domain-containing protein [Roseibium denhamense]MTI04854.1 DUF3540 domain-containing protein [Roseibium denhamense]SMP19948.1 Protein of unknown function [Roseibium denhamense]